MLSPLESLEVKPSIKSRTPLCRTRTLDGSRPSVFFKEKIELVPETAPSTPKPKTNKHVRFADEKEMCEIHLFDPIVRDPEQLKEFYVLPDELREIKRLGFLACKEAKRKGLAGLLSEIYGTSSERDTQDRLNYWCRMGSACRGLERFANEELSKRRNVFRRRAVVSVLEAQEQLKNEKGIDTANVLRRLSEAYTEQSRLLAVRLGAADYHAIQTIKAPPPPPPKPVSPPKTAAATTAPNGKVDNSLRSKRMSRVDRMKERAAATATLQSPPKTEPEPQPENNLGDNGGPFRRNNTTMSAVVLQQQKSTSQDMQ